MKKFAIALALVAAGALGASPAFAWHHHHHGPRGSLGLGFGPYWGPYWGPWGYAPYYPPTVVVAQPAAPTQYVERAEPAPQAGYWYYCETSRGYYPYVKECATGWKAVPPAPPPAQ